MPTQQIPTPRPKRASTKSAAKTIAAATAAATVAPAATPAKPAAAKPLAASPPKAAKTAKPARPSDIASPMIDPDYRRALIAEAAYLRAELRHFAPGYEVEDWLYAESEIDTRLMLGAVSLTR